MTERFGGPSLQLLSSGRKPEAPQRSCRGWLFEIFDTVLESFHFRIERTYCGAVASLPHFDWRRPRMKCGEQFCFDSLELNADPLLVSIGQGHRFDYSALR
jgi:hypothetical protein